MRNRLPSEMQQSDISRFGPRARGSFRVDPVSSDYWSNSPASSLIAEKGKPNEWVIPLPEELVGEVRERLKYVKK